MHRLEAVVEIEIHRILSDFQIQTDYSQQKMESGNLKEKE